MSGAVPEVSDVEVPVGTNATALFSHSAAAASGVREGAALAVDIEHPDWPTLERALKGMEPERDSGFRSGCDSVEDVKPSNKVALESREAALRLGYVLCGGCRP